MITDTTKNPHYDWVMGRNPRAIEEQEAEGQKELVSSSQLPRKGLTEEYIKKFGIELTQLGLPNNDPLFVTVILPQGWTIKATDHSMWSELLDETGTSKAEIFYKAAFYDRDAFIRWN